jgi:hypothetical protein
MEFTSDVCGAPEDASGRGGEPDHKRGGGHTISSGEEAIGRRGRELGERPGSFKVLVFKFLVFLVVQVPGLQVLGLPGGFSPGPLM